MQYDTCAIETNPKNDERMQYLCGLDIFIFTSIIIVLMFLTLVGVKILSKNYILFKTKKTFMSHIANRLCKAYLSFAFDKTNNQNCNILGL